jgi:hypothetical protein
MATYKPLQSSVLTAISSSFTFSSIDQNYTDLVMVINAASDYTPVPDVDTLTLRFNGDASSLYSNTALSGNGTSASASSNSTQTLIRLGQINANTSINPQVNILHINNYSTNNTYKTVLKKGGVAGGKSTATVSLNVGLYRSTNPITSITVYSGSTNFTAGSTFSLYGIKSGAPQALGGDVVTTDGNYWYHAFRSTQNFTPLRPLTVDYLVVAGGGAGYYSLGGGGGAGGLRSTLTQTGGNSVGVNLESTLSVNSQAYTVTVGAGGAATTGNTTNNGSNSSIIGGSVSITSTGGGSGGGASASPLGTGFNGGSGGGGGGSTTGATGYFGGTGTANQGYAGGRNGGAWGLGEVSGGGGGGAGAVGVSCTQGNSVNLGGAGGAGVAISAFATATGTGVSNYYAGGGGGWGSGYPGGNGGGAGGAGGGGAAATYPSTNATSGTANTGGGGGGGHAGYGTSGSGGSGIVIVRYPV